MQLDQLGHVGHHLLGEPERGQPLPGHLGPDHFVMVEGDPAVRQLGAGLRFADVVQERGQSQHQVAGQSVPLFQLDGLAQHGERVLVDVLVPEVLVGLEP